MAQGFFFPSKHPKKVEAAGISLVVISRTSFFFDGSWPAATTTTTNLSCLLDTNPSSFYYKLLQFCVHLPLPANSSTPGPLTDTGLTL
jgi:hypothetical protein